MSRIERFDNEEINWSVPGKKEGHPDYEKNLKTAENFVKKTEKSLLNGMSVKVCDSDHLSKSMMMIAWSPPPQAPFGKYATPISLHQSASDVGKQIEGIFNNYLKRASDFNKRFPRQPEFLDTNLKV